MAKRKLVPLVFAVVVLAGLLTAFMTSGAASASVAGSGRTTAKPKLTITPSEIYYPCSEGSVTFAIKAFAADKKVSLRFGSATGEKVGTITTNAKGSGKTVMDFNDTAPGNYPYYAVSGKTSAEATLEVGTCP